MCNFGTMARYQGGKGCFDEDEELGEGNDGWGREGMAVMLAGKNRVWWGMVDRRGNTGGERAGKG